LPPTPPKRLPLKLQPEKSPDSNPQLFTTLPTVESQIDAALALRAPAIARTAIAAIKIEIDGFRMDLVF
jgi:hypothetical protein